jgi:1-acyl-sn-glycerol-3-phosphate acyltransferase
MLSLLKRACYYFAIVVSRSFFTLGWRLKIEGVENVPRQGPIIIAANHRSYADPPLIGVSMPREVHFMAKAELFRFKPFGWLIGALNAHPLNRSGDIAAFREAQRILEAGYAVIVFPEGRRIKSDELAPPKAGVGMLSSLAKVPVVPAYIHNSNKMKKFKKIVVRFGTPLLSDSFNSYQAMADEVMKRIQKMKDESAP